jgi:hypothetical protein
MNIYLDDDSADHLLVRLLRVDGHDITTPACAGIAGSADPIHLLHAATDQRALLTSNHDDLLALHNLVVQTGGHHRGILVIRKDNDSRRDMTQRAIARAVRNFETAGVPAADGFHILNHWR